MTISWTRWRYLASGALALAALTASPAPSSAYVFTIQDFSVNLGGNPFFHDSFDDGAPPPNAPNLLSASGCIGVACTASYNMFGTMGPESGGALTLNSSGGAPNPFGLDVQEAVLLKSFRNTPVVVSGIFDLRLPGSAVTEGYGVELKDAPAVNHRQSLLGLRLLRDSSGRIAVSFVLNDLAGTITPIASAVIDPTGLDADDFIQLALSVDAANVTSASYRIFDAGNPGQTIALSQTSNYFTSASIFRAGFEAVTPAPEPVTIALFGVGLVGLGLIRRRKTA